VIRATVLARSTWGFTTRWFCRQGDYLLWFRRDQIARLDEAKILDLWSPLDGTCVTITNRWQDFPSWFDLHPTEACGHLMEWMRRRVAARDYPDEPIDGPNIWRVKAGDRVVWVGLPREGQAIVDGVLGVLDCRSAVAVLGDHPDGAFAFMQFEQTPIAVELGAAALRAERNLGQPRVVDTEWLLG
jgi:hypothetical protein